MTVNVALLTKVMEHIEAHPEEHDQGEWARRTACGTTLCFAGHAIVIAGWDPDFEEDSDDAVWCARDAVIGPIEDTAIIELGLTDKMAAELFHENNSRRDLREIVDHIVADAQ